MIIGKLKKLRFTCRREHEGVIPPPVAAKAEIPGWFRKLPAIDKTRIGPNDSGLTVKRCMPFLDAMTAGWILPLAASVRMEIQEGGTRVDSGWDFDQVMVSAHGTHQIKGHPKAHLPPCKFHNYWTVQTPPGWSCLFLPLLNRPNTVFEPVAGIVDTDTYASEIHFPFFATGPDGLHVLEKGLPLVQIIPFQRQNLKLRAEIGVETDLERHTRERILRNTQSTPGWYRDRARSAR